MTFPVIAHIDDVLPALAGREEFVIASKVGYTVIDYRYVLSDSFDDPIRRECRGLKFDEGGRLIARPLHKFFNYGEKPETTWLDYSLPHVVMEKMDGSMIHPAIVDYNVVFMTRMGQTDVAIAAETLFLDEDLADKLRGYLLWGWTPVFEYVGPHNRIVEAYEESELVLLQMRRTVEGRYATLEELQGVADDLGLRLAPVYPAFKGLEDVTSIYTRSTGGEGVVLKFDNDLFVKIKTEEYRRLHRLRDDVTREHDLARVILDGSIDDVLPLFDDKTRDDVLAFAETLLKGVEASTAQVNRLVLTGRELDQKTFAVDHLAGASPAVRTCAFAARKQYERLTFEVVREFLLKATRDAKNFEAAREFCGGARMAAPIYMPEGMAA